MTVMAVSAQTKQEVLDKARRVNNYFMGIWPDPTKDTFVGGKKRPSSLWTRGVYYEGLMALYELDPQQRYIDYTDRWADFHKWEPRNGVLSCDADDQCCEQTYLDRYMMTGEAKMIDRVKENLAHQMKTGNTRKANGALYGWWTWIDAIQMAMPVYSKMYRITGDQKYIDHAMKMYTWSRDTLAGGLFNVQEGLWWRDADFVPPYKEIDGQNCYWSRGTGWVYAALVRVIQDIDDSKATSRQVKKYRESLLKDYMLMSEALKKCQRKDGFWNVSLMSPVTFAGKEASGTALFLYGMSWGIRRGLISAGDYRAVCDRAYEAIANESIHECGFLGYLQGTGKEPRDGQPVTYDRIPDFEDYGAGCVLLGLTEYSKLLN